jgi:hypothetical protein
MYHISSYEIACRANDTEAIALGFKTAEKLLVELGAVEGVCHAF